MVLKATDIPSTWTFHAPSRFVVCYTQSRMLFRVEDNPYLCCVTRGRGGNCFKLRVYVCRWSGIWLDASTHPLMSIASCTRCASSFILCDWVDADIRDGNSDLLIDRLPNIDIERNERSCYACAALVARNVHPLSKITGPFQSADSVSEASRHAVSTTMV